MRVCIQCKSLLRHEARTCPRDGATAEEVEALPQGTKLASYKIERMLGEGGMGFVYEATHEVLGRRTAIKLLRPEFANEAQIVTRFLNEAKAVNLIDHQNIINVYDYGDGADGSVYFVMEFLEGETLDDLMRKRKPMPLPLLLHVFSQIGRALAAAHAKKIVHRDLKPANVYVIAREDNPYFIKLLDFGIAQLRGEGAVKGLTQAGSIMGTPQYMSPEQISGGTVDHRSDVWAMGVMMYRAATGHAPFKGEGFAELAAKILLDPFPPVRELVPDVPVELDKLIKSCLERNLEDRCQSIAELLAGIDRVKVAAKLDDEAILAAVSADAVTSDDGQPSTEEKTRKSIAGSLPQYQGVDENVLAAARSGKLPVRAKTPLPVAEPTSKTGLFAIAGLAVVGLGIGAYLAFGRGGNNDNAPTEPSAPTPSVKLPAKPTTPHDAAVAAIAAAIASGDQQQQMNAVDALALVRHSSAAPQLYIALKGSPELRVKAARALGELKLPDAAPKIRAALAESGDKVKVELAATLLGLGDQDALAILKRAVSDPGMRLVAAIALAEAGDDKTARPVLTELFTDTPVGREQWRRAAYGLAKLGDAKAKGALEGELAQPDAARSVAAAELLARVGEPKASEYLKRVAADPEFARRAEATIALARIGNGDGATWLDAGFGSADAEERKLAIATSALLKDTTRDAAIAKLASDDPDRSVRLTAAAALIARGN